MMQHRQVLQEMSWNLYALDFELLFIMEYSETFYYHPIYIPTLRKPNVYYEPQFKKLFLKTEKEKKTNCSGEYVTNIFLVLLKKKIRSFIQ